MRRAVIATVATAAGLVLLLGYKAGTPTKAQKVAVSGGAAGTTTVPGGTTSTSTPSATTPTAPGAVRTGQANYTGQLVDYNYGDIQVAITIEQSRISNVSVVQNNAVDGRSQMINAEAVPVLEQEAVSAQGVNIDVVSGATYTSNAFAQSLQSALQKAGK
jgi:uncharacterized protein with FMN-binding domain